jgi:hypothetical protein
MDIEQVYCGGMAEEVYTVERILCHKPAGARKAHTLYLVKWQGYSEEECTWEPERNFIDKAVIPNYFASLQQVQQQQQYKSASPSAETSVPASSLGLGVTRH